MLVSWAALSVGKTVAHLAEHVGPRMPLLRVQVKGGRGGRLLREDSASERCSWPGCPELLVVATALVERAADHVGEKLDARVDNKEDALEVVTPVHGPAVAACNGQKPPRAIMAVIGAASRASAVCRSGEPLFWRLSRLTVKSVMARARHAPFSTSCLVVVFPGPPVSFVLPKLLKLSTEGEARTHTELSPQDFS